MFKWLGGVHVVDKWLGEVGSVVVRWQLGVVSWWCLPVGALM